MTKRKPGNLGWRSWIDQQIEEARAKGAFDNLPREGRRLEDLDEVADPGWWAKKLVQREQVSVLPPALEIRREIDRCLEELWSVHDETQVGPLDEEAIVERWCAHREEPQP